MKNIQETFTNFGNPEPVEAGNNFQTRRLNFPNNRCKMFPGHISLSIRIANIVCMSIRYLIFYWSIGSRSSDLFKTLHSRNNSYRNWVV